MLLTVISPKGSTGQKNLSEPVGNVAILLYIRDFSPAEVVGVPFHTSAAPLDTRDGPDEIEEAVSHAGVRPEVDDRVDAGMAECYEEEHGVDVSENMTKKD